MNYTIQLLLWNWRLFIPFLLVFLPLLIAECLKQEQENEEISGLLKICLLLVPLTLVGMVLFFVSGMATSRLHSMLPILVQTVAVGLSVFAGYKFAGVSRLKKKKRILAVIFMFFLYIIETVLFIYIASGMTT